MISVQKKELRKILLKKRDSVEELKYFEQNEQITRLLKLIINSYESGKEKKVVSALGLYWPLKGEPDVLKLVVDSQNRLVALPKILGQKMKYVQYQLDTKLEYSGFGQLMHPKSNVEIIPQIILVPGLAYSINGYRLGFGIGHYDIYLANMKKKIILLL